MKKFIIEPEYNNYKISEYLKDVKGYSTRGLRNSDVYLNGKKVRLDKKIKKLNRLVVVEQKKGTNIEPIPMDLKIVFEDKNLLIINKDANIVVHPTLKKTDKTLANGVVDYFLKTTGQIQVPRFYNRLDMDTSGLIVVAKNAFTQAFLQEKAEIRKFYLAICEGIIEKDEFFITRPIGRVGDNIKREELSVENGGQEAKTKVKVIQRFEDKNLTLVELELFTGRTHQIRVHLSLEGYPILGDSLYGKEVQEVPRQLLHSYKFIYTDIDTHEQKIITINLPDDMKSIIGVK
ncbi:RluA family pseudouridine synthase [Fusobacterium sp.]|uniref:RluA family pseudouridine synthase n=1 Tax=Fusobacterium sp. TaxID=68766 RepID=UPI002617908E|nr:RluA family pseudouridine synthase [Fusobacterium sp.]